MFGVGIGSMSQKITFNCSTFSVPVFTTSRGVGETDWLQIVVGVAECSTNVHDNIPDGVGMVAAVGVALKTLVGSE